MRTLGGFIVIGLLAASGGALAQVAPHGADPHRYQVERHQARMEALNLQADRRADQAARQALQTRQTLQALEASREPAPYVDRAAPPEDPAVTGERHRRTREAVTQIDDWLDRVPD